MAERWVTKSIGTLWRGWRFEARIFNPLRFIEFGGTAGFLYTTKGKQFVTIVSVGFFRLEAEYRKKNSQPV